MTPPCELDRRTLLAGVPAVLFLSACSSNSGSGGSAGPSASAYAAPPDAFPITIEHALGKTVIESPPQRVLSLGDVDLDALLALGMIPVGDVRPVNTSVDDYPEYVRELLGDADFPALPFDPTPDEVLALDPDLITCVSWFGIEDLYETYSDIAPVILGQEVNTYIPRSETVKIIARALGRAQEGEALAAKTDAEFARARAQYRHFEGKTAIFILPDPSGVWLNTSNDTRQKALEELGFVFPDALRSAVADAAFGQLSPEQSGMLEADVVVVPQPSTDEERRLLESDALLQGTKAFSEGRVVEVDEDLYGAIRSYSVLSAGYVAQKLPPLLNDALVKL